MHGFSNQSDLTGSGTATAPPPFPHEVDLCAPPVLTAPLLPCEAQRNANRDCSNDWILSVVAVGMMSIAFAAISTLTYSVWRQVRTTTPTPIIVADANGNSISNSHSQGTHDLVHAPTAVTTPTAPEASLTLDEIQSQAEQFELAKRELESIKNQMDQTHSENTAVVFSDRDTAIIEEAEANRVARQGPLPFAVPENQIELAEDPAGDPEEDVEEQAYPPILSPIPIGKSIQELAMAFSEMPPLPDPTDDESPTSDEAVPEPPEICSIASGCESASHSTPKDDGLRRLGTKLVFAESMAEAQKLALKQDKLLFVMHVSGNFEIEGFT